ncbi:hypothetical protein HPB50_022194 [Hyalomma asiaticum]|uniref:Uncharacterized protein n=1 Tax=Hyalomma asiaticum TaxID=266040 RepID=A0ACB7TBG3_HYAAI|nr:hypothetical protein HPB50_022194 [Hyalomma asiaticum]
MFSESTFESIPPDDLHAVKCEAPTLDGLSVAYERRFQPLACLRSASERGRRNHPPRRGTRRTKRRTPVRHRKQDLTAKAASASTESLLNTESFLAHFVLPDPPLLPAGEAKEAAAANVSTTTTTRDSPDPPLPPPEEAEEAAAAMFTAPAPTTRDSPPPVRQITGTPRELVFREEVENTSDQRESDDTNPSFSSANSLPSTSSDVTAKQLISVAPANATVQGASSSPSQPKEEKKEDGDRRSQWNTPSSKHASLRGLAIRLFKFDPHLDYLD